MLPLAHNRSTRAAHSRCASVHEDDEEALKWAALERLPTYNRLRIGILRQVTEAGTIAHSEVAVAKLGLAEKERLLHTIVPAIEEDNERFLLKLRGRIDKVQVDLPKVEIRFENLHIEADVYRGARAIPTLYNVTINALEGISSLLVPPQKHCLKILNNLSGVVNPSRLTLLLGPPSSGKTTLLLALAGKLSSDLRVSGKVTYNGHEMTEFVPERTSAYISQHDLQSAEMTVREVLDFCARCQGVGSRYDMLVELSRREKAAGIIPDPDIDVFMKASAVEGQETSILTNYVLKILGLDICANNLVGDQMQRGISGGQKKRLTTGEMLVGASQVLLMDEISTGLDSSTTFQMVKCLQQIANVLNFTMLISLLQPAPETFELFDDVILLSEGEIVYQGPREFILDFFKSMGFQCPARKGVADFLQEVTSKKDQGQYWANQGYPHRYISVKQFADAFKFFHVGRCLHEQLVVPFDKSKSHPAALSTRKYGLPVQALFKACFWREWLLMRRNSFIYAFQAFQVTILTFISLSVFVRTQLHQDTIADANLYMGELFFSISMVMFNGFSEMAMIVTRLPVFFKEREHLFYPAWAYSIPIIMLKIPLSVLDSLIWVCFSYYMIGFSPNPSRFFSQILLYFCASQVALGIYRFVGTLGRSMVLASPFVLLYLLVVFISGGFVISKDRIHKWCIWAFWTSPMMYGQQGLAINEFLADRWKKPYNGIVDAQTIGVAVMKSHGLRTEEHWFWISVGALIGFAILFNVLFTLALTYLNPLSTSRTVSSDENSTEKTSRSSWPSQPLASDPADENCGFEKPTADQSRVTKGTVKTGMVLLFQPRCISFSCVSYFVDMPLAIQAQGVSDSRLQLLHDVTGSFRPGILTALMGVSGAGKTTLMDVLSGRKTGGYIEGDIRISGYPKKQETFARISGYCEQNDIHSPNITVIESLVFSAWLRLPAEIDKTTRMNFVEEVMELVELDPIRYALVGFPGVDGLSTEQRKRLTIAVELVANPSIIFLDEPTSGLDARAAAIVMRSVRNTVETGRTVVCTIHQPSIDIFEAFDELLLLKRGGQVIYAGSLGLHSCHLVDYFQAIPGVPLIKEGYNPAAWMLDISSTSVESRLKIDFAEVFKHSSLYQQNQALVEELSVPPLGSKDLSFNTTYAQSFLYQCIACLWKQHWSYWRYPAYNAVRTLFTIGVALVCGALFWKAGHKLQTIQDIFNLVGALYSSVLFIGFSNGTSVQPVVGIERTVFYRERGAGMYSALAYAFAQAIIEIPYIFMQMLVFVWIMYPMVNFEWSVAKLFYFCFFTFFTFLNFSYVGMMCVAVTWNLQLANILMGLCIVLWNLFSGFILFRKDTPLWWRWFDWVNPIQWTIYGLLASQLGDINTPIIDIDFVGVQPTIKQYIEDNLGYKHDFLGVVVGMHIVWTFLFLFMFAYGIKKFNFQNR